MKQRLDGLAVFRELLKDGAVAAFRELLQDCCRNDADNFVSNCGEFESLLFQQSDCWTAYLRRAVMESENVCIRNWASGAVTAVQEECLNRELVFLDRLSQVTLDNLTAGLDHAPDFLVGWRTEGGSIAQDYRQRMQETLQESRTVLWEQYADFAQVLTNVSRELDSSYGADPLAEQRLIRYLRTIGVEADAAVFRESTGRLRVTIDSRYLRPLLELPDYLDKLSATLGVRLCMPENAARDDSLLLLEAEPLAVSVGIASMRKKGETVSGDRGTYFKTDVGQLCVILSDGMGCGETAADGSISTVGMLEEFLRSGVSPALAMKLLNSAMLLRDGENWGYATVDLMCMNLFTGEADFYKYGAAPTYVKSGGALKKLRCTSFAPGLEQESGKAPDELHMHLKPGSVAVIASDGVVSDGHDAWLRRLLSDSDDSDMKTLAGSVVRAAIREYGRSDDMTALAVKVEVRS